MNNLASEFQAVSQLYSQIGEELAGVMCVNDSGNSSALAEAILQHRDCLARIEQMNARVLYLSEEWKKRRPNLDADTYRKIDGLAETARVQAMRLNDLCGNKMQTLQAARDRLAKRLEELGKGTRYLKSVKSTKSNYPKFIDSLY